MKNLGSFLIGGLSSLGVSAFLVACLKKKWEKKPVSLMKIGGDQSGAKVGPNWVQSGSMVGLQFFECMV